MPKFSMTDVLVCIPFVVLAVILVLGFYVVVSRFVREEILAPLAEIWRRYRLTPAQRASENYQNQVFADKQAGTQHWLQLRQAESEAYWGTDPLTATAYYAEPVREITVPCGGYTGGHKHIAVDSHGDCTVLSADGRYLPE